MSGSLNKVELIGNLGADPDIRVMQSGDKVANLSIATSDSWKDRTTGEKQERTQWHRVVVFNQGLVGVIEQYCNKGDKLFLQGQLETRKWTDQQGVEKYTTEVVLRPFNSALIMLSGRSSGGPPPNENYDGGGGGTAYYDKARNIPPDNADHPVDDYDDSEIPF